LGAQPTERLAEVLSKFINLVAVRLPDDVYARLEELSRREISPWGRLVYDAVFRNLELATRRRAPLCQDTGTPQFYLSIGEGFPYGSALLKAIEVAVVRSTELGYLRPNVVDPVTGRNTGNNLGPRAPWVEVELAPGIPYADVRLYLAGGGSSRPAVARTLDPAEGWEGVVRFVIDTVAECGAPACPPLMVVGVGVGATVDIAASLSKKALLRPLGTRNPDPWVAELEVLLEEAINSLGIGPQGLGGSVTVGEVHVEYAGRHPATLAVGVSISCWALRRGYLRVYPDLTYEVLSHRGAELG